MKHIERALTLCDSNACYWNNYGAVLRDLRRHHEAKAAFEKAIAIRADYPDAWSNRNPFFPHIVVSFSPTFPEGIKG